MKSHRLSRHRRRQRQAALKLALLMLPALFWSVVFATLAGVRPFEHVANGVPGAVQVLVAVTCPLLAVILGVAVIRQEASGAVESAMQGRITVAAGVALLVFAVLASLSPS
ncbi:MAG: hypothetical protein LC754_02470 [Acidobacteria bacterium]|nr:hypothetical protein [Acidobacteriota bacterium]